MLKYYLFEFYFIYFKKYLLLKAFVLADVLFQVVSYTWQLNHVRSFPKLDIPANGALLYNPAVPYILPVILKRYARRICDLRLQGEWRKCGGSVDDFPELTESSPGRHRNNTGVIMSNDRKTLERLSSGSVTTQFMSMRNGIDTMLIAV